MIVSLSSLLSFTGSFQILLELVNCNLLQDMPSHRHSELSQALCSANTMLTCRFQQQLSVSTNYGILRRSFDNPLPTLRPHLPMMKKILHVLEIFSTPRHTQSVVESSRQEPWIRSSKFNFHLPIYALYGSVSLLFHGRYQDLPYFDEASTVYM